MKRVLIVAAAMTMVWSAAADVTVTNYSWLQLGPGQATSFVGNPTDEFIFTEASSVEGPASGIRWGHYQWIPRNAFSDYGATDYWAGIVLDQPRDIAGVNVSLWCSGHETVSHFYIEAIVGGVWTVIGEYDFATPATGARTTVMNVAVTAGEYQYIRMRFDVDGYEYSYDNPGGRSYGGPGVILFEPFSGETTLTPGDRVNWANKASFPGATVTNSFIRVTNDDSVIIDDVRSSSASLNNGTFRDDQPWNGMNRDMLPGEFIEIDLDATRSIDNVTLLFMGNYSTSSFRVWVSDDKDGPFTEVLPLLNGTLYPTETHVGALGFDFAAVDAQYVRITDMKVVTGGYWSIAQILVNGTVVPEPATMSLLGLGALALLRRRRA